MRVLATLVLFFSLLGPATFAQGVKCMTCFDVMSDLQAGNNGSFGWALMFSQSEDGTCSTSSEAGCGESEGCQFTWQFFSGGPAGPYGWDEGEVGYGRSKPPFVPGARPWVSSSGSTIAETHTGSQITTTTSCGHYTYIQAKPNGETGYASATLKCTSCLLVEPSDG